jgi:hypothetical protein
MHAVTRAGRPNGLSLSFAAALCIAIIFIRLEIIPSIASFIYPVIHNIRTPDRHFPDVVFMVTMVDDVAAFNQFPMHLIRSVA